MYTEAAVLFRVNETEQPIRIGRIESGSLLAEVVGNTVVIGLIAKALAEGTKYLHRTYTDEGRIGQIPKNVRSMEALFGLQSGLQEAGIDTSSMSEEIAKGSAKMATCLNQLLGDEPNVVVNGTHITLGTEVSRLMLEEARTRLLPAAPAPDEGEAAEAGEEG